CLADWGPGRTFLARGLGESRLSDRIRWGPMHRCVPRSEKRKATVGANRRSHAGGAKIQTERFGLVHSRGGRDRPLRAVLRVRTGGLFPRWTRALAPAPRAIHAAPWNGKFAGAGGRRGGRGGRSSERLLHRRVPGGVRETEMEDTAAEPGRRLRHACPPRRG